MFMISVIWPFHVNLSGRTSRRRLLVLLGVCRQTEWQTGSLLDGNFPWFFRGIIMGLASSVVSGGCSVLLEIDLLYTLHGDF